MSPVHRQLAGEVLHLELASEATQLEAGDVLRATGRNARTLVKEGPLRITLFVLAPRGHIAAHRALAPVSIQVLRGTLHIRAGQSVALDLAAGELLVLGAGVDHAVSSDAGGLFLLTVVHAESGDGSDTAESRKIAASDRRIDAGHGSLSSAAEPISRPIITATDSTGLTYSCRDGEIWVHYPARGAPAPGPNDPGFAIGPIPPSYATHPPNAITAERVRLWRSLCSQQ